MNTITIWLPDEAAAILIEVQKRKKIFGDFKSYLPM